MFADLIVFFLGFAKFNKNLNFWIQIFVILSINTPSHLCCLKNVGSNQTSQEQFLDLKSNNTIFVANTPFPIATIWKTYKIET